MKAVHLFLVSVLFLASPLGFAADDKKRFAWPNGAKAAVNLAYDDALNSHLDVAIPALDKHGLKGTFYLFAASPVMANRWAEWQAAAANGHELANHSLFHRCSGSLPDRDWQPAYRDLDKTTVAQLKEEIAINDRLLHAMDGKTERTYTTPCADLMAAGENYVDAIKSDFVGIKARLDGITRDMSTFDPYNVSIVAPVNLTGQELINIVKEAAAKGTMANITFHGVDGDHLPVSAKAHEELLKYLAANQDVYWVDTFINIVKYVKSKQGAQPQGPRAVGKTDDSRPL